MDEFKTGDKVMHHLFGPGIVRGVAGMGPDAKITVDFASSVGQKKLLASVAKLSKASGGEVQNAAWFESLDASGRPRRGRWVDRDQIRQTLLWEVRKPQFWTEVRDKLRARSLAPKMLDDPSRRVSVSASGILNVRIRIKHDAPNDAQEQPCASVMFEILQAGVLRDFEWFSIEKNSGPSFSLVDEDLIEIEEETPLELPERAPLQRPKRVQPKGSIRSMPKRRDDY